MATNNFSGYGYLDRQRLSKGIDACKAAFIQIYHRDRRGALNLLNDRRLTFSCLFILTPEIQSLHLYRDLNARHITALGIIHQILKLQGPERGMDYLSNKLDTVYPVLKWILQTGIAEDGMNDDYEQVLDITVSVLINVYQDKSVLPLAADMILKRNKKGHYIHDLVWAIFQIHDPYALMLIAEHIRSLDYEDAALACELLNIEELNSSGTITDTHMQYESYLQWLNENDPFLYFTGESFQFTSRPAFCRVDLERKYMQKGIPSYNKQPIGLLDDDEYECLNAFKPLSDEEKTILSEYSHTIRNIDVTAWKRWMHSPIGVQINVAKAEQEGAL